VQFFLPGSDQPQALLPPTGPGLKGRGMAGGPPWMSSAFSREGPQETRTNRCHRTPWVTKGWSFCEEPEFRLIE